MSSLYKEQRQVSVWSALVILRLEQHSVVFLFVCTMKIFKLKCFTPSFCGKKGDQSPLHPSVSEVVEGTHETDPWGSDVDPEVMESKLTEYPLSLSLTLSCQPYFSSWIRAWWAVYQPESIRAVSFGFEEILFTIASDSEEFGDCLFNAFPVVRRYGLLSPSHPSLRKLTEVVSCVVDRLWRKEPQRKCLLIKWSLAFTTALTTGWF